MKKLLLSLAAVAMVSAFAYADTATYTPTAVSGSSDPYTFTMSTTTADAPAFEFKANKNSGTTAPTYNRSNADVRIYAKGDFIVTVPEKVTVTKMVFNISTQGLKRLTSITPNVGSIATQAKGDQTVTWTGDILGAESIKLTVGEKTQYGSDAETTAGQFDFNSVEITYTVAADSGKESAGLAFAQTSMTLGTTAFFILPTLTNPHDLPVTYTSSNPEVLAVTDFGEDADPNWRWSFAIKGPGECVLTATTEETDQYDAGKATIDIKVVKAAANIPQMFEYAPNSKDKVLMSGTLTVVAAGKNGNNSYIYVTDLYDNATLLYGSNLSIDYQKGDQLPGGWEAEYSPYYGLPEWKGSFPTPSACFPDFVTYPLVETVTDADINKVVNISGIVLDADTELEGKNGNINAKFADGTPIVIRNNFLLPDVEAGTYDVIAAVAIYNNTLQLYPFEYNEHVVYPTFPENITVSSDAKSCSSSLAEEYGYLTLTVNMTTENDEATFTVNTPEGYDCVYVQMYPEYGDDDFGGFLRNAAAASWVDPAMYGLDGPAPSATVKADGEEHYGILYLGFNGKLDAANTVDITVKATRSGSTGVEAVEVAEGEAVYYNLQGVKIVNPEKGVYVKVLNGKAEKVVL